MTPFAVAMPALGLRKTQGHAAGAKIRSAGGLRSRASSALVLVRMCRCPQVRCAVFAVERVGMDIDH